MITSGALQGTGICILELDGITYTISASASTTSCSSLLIRTMTVDKPSWINEVKEITREEAELLVSLGVEVRGDFNHRSQGWYDRADSCWVASSPKELINFYREWSEYPLLFWIPKE